MEQETLYTAAKWDILKALSSAKRSPIELAELSNTSVSNISQSLRFLELAGLVKSERIGNRDKGQPRVAYSLASDKAYLIVTSNEFTEKKQLALDENKRALLRIWFYDDVSIHLFLEKAFYNLQDSIHLIKEIHLDTTVVSEIRIIIVPKEQKLELKQEQKSKLSFDEISAKSKGITRKIKYSIIDDNALQKNKHNYYTIYKQLTQEK